MFTIHAAGKYMTFVTSPTHHEYFFHSTHADFQQAVQPFTQRAGKVLVHASAFAYILGVSTQIAYHIILLSLSIAGVSRSSFFTYHQMMRDSIKGSFVPITLGTMCHQLSRELHNGISKMEEGEVDLMTLVKSIMFPVIVAKLFGNDVMPEGKVWLLYCLFAKY